MASYIYACAVCDKMSDFVETTESQSWGLLLCKLRESGASGRQDKSQILQGLLQHSLQLENRQSLTQDDVMMIVKLLSDWYNPKQTPETLTTTISRDEALLSLIKLLRNSCAGVPSNQHYLLKAGALAEASKLVSYFVTSHQRMLFVGDSHPGPVVTAMLQLLGNICVGFQEGQEKVWMSFFPQTLRSILDTFGEVEMVCMILHNCTCTEDAKNRRQELVASEGGVALLSHIVRAQQKDGEWRLIFLRSFLEQTPPSRLHRVLIPFQQQYGLWTALLETACHIMDSDDESWGGVGGAKGAWPRWEEGECVYLVEVWMEEVGRVISDQAAILTDCSKVNPTDQLSANMSVGNLASVLRLLCCLSIRENYLRLLQRQTHLLDSAIALLKELSALDGSTNSTKHISSLKKSKKSAEVRKEEPLFGIKRNLMQLISSLLYRCPVMQERIRALEAVPLILNQCHIDHNNPYIMQWAVLTIRNMCEDNPANQELIAKLETRGVAEATAAQFQPGCEVEVTGNGRLRGRPKP